MKALFLFMYTHIYVCVYGFSNRPEYENVNIILYDYISILIVYDFRYINFDVLNVKTNNEV